MWRRLMQQLRQKRVTAAVLVDARRRLVRRGVPAEQAEAWVVEFVAYLQLPVPSCQAMWRWVCNSYGTSDWPLRMHWVAVEAQKCAAWAETTHPHTGTQEVASGELND